MDPVHIGRIWGIHPKRILHVGAHNAEELDSYVAAGWGSEAVVWVEADPESCEATRRATSGLPNHVVVQALAWRESGVLRDFHRASNGESSSTFPMESHKVRYPHIRVEEVLSMQALALQDSPQVRASGPFDFVNLDVQGAELPVLEGMGDLLADIGAVYTEVSFEPLYRDAPLFDEIASFLEANGFHLIDLSRTRRGWGDSLWMREFPSGSHTRKSRHRKWLSAQSFARRMMRTKLLRHAPEQ